MWVALENSHETLDFFRETLAGQSKNEQLCADLDALLRGIRPQIIAITDKKDEIRSAMHGELYG